MGIFLSPEARIGWEKAGKLEIRDFGDRIIATKVLVHDERGRQQYLYLASAYAPQSGDVIGRAQFLQQLQRLFDSVKKNELLVLSVDANAAMGVRGPTTAGVPKSKVLGPNGVGHVNNAGRDLYQLLDANEMCSAATFFKPKVNHATWIHPGNGHGYQNDHFILKQRDLRRVRACQPTTVTGVVSDHLPLTLRLRVTTNMEQHMKKPAPRPYIDRTRLSNESVADEFLALLEADLNALEEIEDRPDSLTRLIKAIQGASKNSLAVLRKRVPSWFEEHAHVLVPAIQARNARLREHLARKTIGSATALKKARRTLKTSMKGAINAWHSKVLDGVNQLGEVNTGSNAGRPLNTSEAWEKVRELERGRSRIKKVVHKRLRKEDGTYCETDEENAKVMAPYLKSVFSKVATYDSDAVRQVRQRDRGRWMHFANRPTRQEIIAAIRKLKNGKSGGDARVPAEFFKVLLRAAGSRCLDNLMSRYNEFWET